MKSLFTFVLLTALVAFGGAFIGKWKIPGLEDLPTAESVKQMTKTVEPPAEDIFPGRLGDREKKPVTYFTPTKDSASKSRNEQLLERGKEIGGE